jgi:hypothetical protein
MDVDPMEYVEDEDKEIQKDGKPEESAAAKARSRLNTWVAITVALIATFMGLCSVKDGNIVQAMQQNQADKIDNWNFYQARNVREAIYQATADQMRVLAATAPLAAKAEYEKQIAAYDKRAKDQEEKKAQQKADAEKADRDYNRWNTHDDQFDLSEALLSLAIALLATTSLTNKRALYFVALVPTFFGVLMGLAGLLNWSIHWDWAAKVLGT